MTIKLSHSGKNKYLTCPKSYELRYIKKLVPRLKGSALFFGSAIDVALNYMLVNKDNPNVLKESLVIFEKEWAEQKDNKYDLVKLAKCEDISYFKNDFDPLLLDQFDRFGLPENFLELREEIEYKKKDLGWYNLTPEERQLYNYTSWLSLKNKGLLFISAYHEQIIPKIKRTLAVQMEIGLTDADGAMIAGFIDAVVELQNGRVVVLDNKTSSRDYEDKSVSESEQLALYKTLLTINGKKIDGAAYAVLLKKLNKITIKVCQSCGHKGSGSHAKCDAIVNKKRCNGTWTKTYDFTVNTQFIVDNIPEVLEDKVLQDADNIVEAIKANHFPQNFDSCMGQYGKCEFYNLCHENSMVDLIDITGKKKDG